MYVPSGSAMPLRITLARVNSFTACTWSPNGKLPIVGVATLNVESETEIRRIGSLISLLPVPNLHAFVVPHGVFTAE